MTTIINGSSPSITFSDSTTQTTAFNGQALSASPYTTALGASTLVNNTGTANTAVGNSALASNTTASYNTAVGYQAGYTNATGKYNTFLGHSAGYTSNNSATVGSNTFVGSLAGYAVTTGTNNNFFGGLDSTGGVAAGSAVTTGSKNTILGSYSGNQGGLDIRTASNNIVLSDGDGTPMLYITGNNAYCNIPSVYTSTTANSPSLWVRSDGFIARSTSALKYKQDIRDLESIDINKFRPVRYKSKCESDDQTIDHFGIIADEVDQAGIKELVSYGADGEVEGFQYERLTVVLLKAIQELKAEFDAYKATHP